ncbi:MAG: EamA family transporter [candidate division Zixibacteria bacterium]|nr:EamA family transporter [candidate division Zixibacteria bacterium]
MKTIALILLSVALGVTGQIFLKQGVSAEGPITGLNRALLTTIFRPLVLLGLFCYGLSSVSWLVVLSRTELSYAYPMIALGYVLIFLLSWWLFGDKVTWVRVVGLFLICFGVVLVAITKPPGTN